MIMGQWVLTVTGIAILAVLCDIILPDGQTRKYIKTVIGIVVTLVMIQPIVGFVGGSLVFDENNIDNSGTQIQQPYLDAVNEKQLQASLTIVKDVLTARGVDVQITDVDSENKTISLSSDAKYSYDNKALIDKVFGTYFSDYKITINWK